MITPEEEVALGRALKTIGDELAGADPDTHSASSGIQAPWWRNGGLLGAAAAAVIVVGVVFASMTGPDQSDDGGEGSRSLTDVQWVACAAGIGFGEVTSVAPGSMPEKVVLTVSVRRWLKAPQHPTLTETFETMSGDFTGDPEFEIGQRILFLLQDIPTEPAEVFRTGTARHPSAADIEQTVEKQLPKAATTECPAFWRNRTRESPPGRDDG